MAGARGRAHGSPDSFRSRGVYAEGPGPGSCPVAPVSRRPDRRPDGTGAPVRVCGSCVMRTGAARGHVGHFHEAGFYGSDAEFAALIVPFVEEGVAAGEPVIIGYDGRKAG